MFSLSGNDHTLFGNVYGCAADAVSVKRNAFLPILTSIESIFLSIIRLKLSHQVYVLHLISLMKVER